MEMSIFISVRKERLPKMWGKTTIKDVASKCGVSTATVSRAINNNGYVSKELKDMILSACSELGYSLSVRPEYYNASHFLFAEGVNSLEQYAAAVPGNAIDLSNIFTYTKSSFTYNPETGLYAKNLHEIGRAHV